VCDFLLVIDSNFGPILPRFRDIAGLLFSKATPSLFHPNFGGVPLGLDCHVVAPMCEDPELIISIINFGLVHLIGPQYINVTDRQTDRRTDRRTTYDSNASRGNNSSFTPCRVRGSLPILSRPMGLFVGPYRYQFTEVPVFPVHVLYLAQPRPVMYTRRFLRGRGEARGRKLETRRRRGSKKNCLEVSRGMAIIIIISSLFSNCLEDYITGQDSTLFNYILNHCLEWYK